MKKIIMIIAFLTTFYSAHSCGGFYFDDGSRALKLAQFIRAGDVGRAQALLESSNVSTQMRFKHGNNVQFKSIVGIALELGHSQDKEKRKAMIPAIRLLRKHNFFALPEDVDAAKVIAGRDQNGNKGALQPYPGEQKPHGVHARGLVSMVENMPVLKKNPEDADFVN